MPTSNRTNALLLLIIVTQFLVSSTATHAGDLANVQKSVEGASSASEGQASSEKKTKEHRRLDGDYDDSDSTNIFFQVFGPPIFYTVTSPWWGPAAVVGDDYSLVPDFPAYPYEGDHEGYLIFSDEKITSQSMAARFTSEYANDFSGLQRYGGRIQLDTTSRFGLDTEWNHWREEVTDGTDTLWTGDANLIFRFAQSEHAQFYTGLGLNWLGGEQGDVGFNFTYGVDLFPIEPIIFRSVLDMGTLGDADLYHGKTTIGVSFRNFEVFTGYDILHIGDSNLHGLIAGLTLWF